MALYGPFLTPHPLLETVMTESEAFDAAMQVGQHGAGAAGRIASTQGHWAEAGHLPGA